MGTTLPHLDDRIRGYPDDDADDACDTDPYLNADYNWTGWPADSRWRPATAIVGAVVALGAIATAVIINSGDSASTKATVGASAPHSVTSAPATTKASVPPSASPSPSRPLPAETFTTAQTPTAAPPLAAAPTVTVDPRTVVYSVSGSKQLLDLVNVVYTDAHGVPQTEFNVSLPWSKVVVLEPGVQTESVVATSFYGRLSCSIFNAAGQRVVASANASNMATCAR
ncbi:MmpS family transport accessory protein [Mycobacterium avium subsp. paratuberculosis]|nr:MmpS family transport accessory protein [Mycobacterium avium subsp. paratuberculosis]